MMKSFMIAFGLLADQALAAGGAPVGECVSVGDEFCDSHLDHNHPSLKDGPWNYSYYHGRNWKDITRKALNLQGTQQNECGGTNQSPIDLRNSWTKISAKSDNFQKQYTNPKSQNAQDPDIFVDWNGHTSQISVNKNGNTTNVQQFGSQHGMNYYNASEKYSGLQFHFHHGSEHTVEGKRHDLEMHTVHLADAKNAGNMFAAAMGLMFSVNDASREFSEKEISVIDTFFDSLQWDKSNAEKKSIKVNQVSYGDLMMMVDMNNRWTYRGSVTTPPCAQNVYWNVLRTVYPVKQRHLDLFKEELALDGIDKSGNFREIQPLTKDHDPVIISTMEMRDKVLNHFNFALANDTKGFSDTTECSNACSQLKNKCCAKLTMIRGSTNESDYQCVKKDVADGVGVEMDLDNIFVKIQCNSALYFKAVVGSSILAFIAFS